MKKWISILIVGLIVIIVFIIARPKLSENYYQKALAYSDSSKY